MNGYYAEGDGPEFEPGHCQHIEPGPTVFYGEPKVFYLAICTDCAPGLQDRPNPMRFGTEGHRDNWINGHSTSHPNITKALEVIPS